EGARTVRRGPFVALSSAPRRVDLVQLLHDRPERRLEGSRRIVADSPSDERRYPEVRERLRSADDVPGRRARAVVGAHGDLDLGHGAPERVAVRAEHVDLVRDLVGVAEEVARVGVLGDQAERLPLTTAPDHDPGTRGAHRLGPTQRLLELVVAPAV